jgi:hypothetical protein
MGTPGNEKRGWKTSDSVSKGKEKWEGNQFQKLFLVKHETGGEEEVKEQNSGKSEQVRIAHSHSKGKRATMRGEDLLKNGFCRISSVYWMSKVSRPWKEHE